MKRLDYKRMVKEIDNLVEGDFCAEMKELIIIIAHLMLVIACLVVLISAFWFFWWVIAVLYQIHPMLGMFVGGLLTAMFIGQLILAFGGKGI